MSNFQASLKHVLVHEGGFVNHPKDPGGATNKGVIQRTYDGYRRGKNLATRSVRSITDAEVADIYKSMYWDRARCGDLPAGPDYATFDSSVNSGVSRGVRWLQRATGASADGVAGPKTVQAARAADPVVTVKRMCADRMGFLRGLSHFSTFGRGWTRRVTEVEAVGVAMAVAALGISKHAVRVSMEDEASAAKSTAQNQEAGAGTATVGSAGTATTIDWSATSAITPLILTVCAIGVIALVAILIRKSRINRARAAAYAAVAEDLKETVHG